MISEENSMEDLRHELGKIEKNIREIKKTLEGRRGKWYDPKILDQMQTQLILRRNILNRMFVPSEDNLKKLISINDHLYSLTMKLHKRVQKLYAAKSLWFDDHDFDDSFNLEGTLQFVYNDSESVLGLNDDSYYGSDFEEMIETIYKFHTIRLKYIETANPDIPQLDDGKSWNEYPFHDSVYDGIIICHAVHSLCDHQLYSIPDLLRLNDFWAEVKLEVQSITNQFGFRFKDGF